jgi:hypothetical protein
MSDYPAGTILGAWPVTLGDLALDRVDEHSVEWTLTSVSGWGAASTSGEVVDRPRRNGAWAPKWTRKAKEYNLALAVDAETPEERWAAEQRLIAAASAEDTTLIFHEEVERRATVRLNGDVQINRTSPYTFDADLSLLALDPLRYTVEPDVYAIGRDRTVVIDNIGNTDAWPTYRLDGPLSSPTLTDATGRFLRLDADLPANAWAVVDTANRQIRMFDDPDAQLRGVLAGNWFPIPQGGTTVRLTATAGTGRATATTYGTWL